MYKLHRMNVLHKNNRVKVVILSIIAVCLCAVILRLIQISNQKKILAVDLLSFVPQTTSTFIYGKSIEVIGKAVHLPEPYQKLIQLLSAGLRQSPSALLCDSKSFVFCQKISENEQNWLLNDRLRKAFSSFAPRMIDHNNTRYYFYAAPLDSFFICTFIDGVFLGSYDFRMLQSAVDAHQQGKTFHCDEYAKAVIKKYYNQGKAVFFDRNETRSTALVQTGDKLSGIITPRPLAVSASTKAKINLTLLPPAPFYFAYEQTVSFPLDSTIVQYAEGNQYEFHLSTEKMASARLTIIPLQPEVKLADSIRKHISTQGKIKACPFLSFFGQYYLFKGNISASGNNDLFWTQWRTYLLISNEAKAIVHYVRQKEQIRRKQSPPCWTTLFSPNASAMYYSNNVSGDSCKLFSPLLKKLLGVGEQQLVLDYSSDGKFTTFSATFF